jgi:NADH:ubiquinone oxidoreductase subunit
VLYGFSAGFPYELSKIFSTLSIKGIAEVQKNKRILIYPQNRKKTLLSPTWSGTVHLGMHTDGSEISLLVAHKKKAVRFIK